MHGGRIDLRGTVGELAVTCFTLFGREHQPADLGEQRRAVGGGDLDLDRLGEV